MVLTLIPQQLEVLHANLMRLGYAWEVYKEHLTSLHSAPLNLKQAQALSQFDTEFQEFIERFMFLTCDEASEASFQPLSPRFSSGVLSEADPERSTASTSSYLKRVAKTVERKGILLVTAEINRVQPAW